MGAQEYFWDTFSNLKRDQFYLNAQIGRLDFRERCLNCFSAFAASGAVATWAVWKDYPMFWATIIAASQVYQVMKPHLPFAARLKATSSMYPEFELLTHIAEKKWFEVSTGKLTEDEIYDAATELKHKKIELTHKHLRGVIFSEKKKHVDEADQIAIAYMSNFT